ncbi:MAG TPA: hypothetical protein VE869_16885 [Gemmatimonas sp.]|nr:hypothetical protein [Gemmatimonas sp.]
MSPDPASRRPRRPRRGFLLPMVLLSLLLVASLSAATQFGAWRATRAARLAWNGERATHAADEALSMVVSAWQPGLFAARAIGERWAQSVVTGDGAVVSVALVRTAPLALVAMAHATSKVSGASDTASRRIVRALALHGPTFPVRGAVTSIGALAIDTGAEVDGRDAVSAVDGCGSTRDTLSITAVHGGAVSVDMGASLSGSATVVAPGLGSPLNMADQTAFGTAWNESSARTSEVRHVAAGAPLVASAAWHSIRVVGNDTVVSSAVVLDATSTHDGLLLVDGDLVVRGKLVVRGLLVVRGALDVVGGSLDVLGAVIVGGRGAGSSRLGPGTRVRYSPCTMRRAMAAVSRPGRAPFGHWIPR